MAPKNCGRDDRSDGDPDSVAQWIAKTEVADHHRTPPSHGNPMRERYSGRLKLAIQRPFRRPGRWAAHREASPHSCRTDFRSGPGSSPSPTEFRPREETRSMSSPSFPTRDPRRKRADRAAGRRFLSGGKCRDKHQVLDQLVGFEIVGRPPSAPPDSGDLRFGPCASSKLFGLVEGEES